LCRGDGVEVTCVRAIKASISKENNTCLSIIDADPKSSNITNAMQNKANGAY